MPKISKPKVPAGKTAHKRPQTGKPTMKTANKTIAKPKGAQAKGVAVRSAPKKNNNKRGSGSAKPQFNHYEQQRLDRIREKDEQKAKKEEKKLHQKKERTKKMKILTKKNRKGQPLMNGRMELLLEKIKKSM